MAWRTFWPAADARATLEQMPPSWALLGTLLFTVLCTTACPGQKSGPPKPCRKAFEQCQLPDGPLGVCQEVSCAAGQIPPCFNCVSQH